MVPPTLGNYSIGAGTLLVSKRDRHPSRLASGLLAGLPSLIWQWKTKRNLRDLAERLEAFNVEREAQRRRGIPRDATREPDRRASAAAVSEWSARSRRAFSEQFLQELRKRQEEWDSRESSDRDDHAYAVTFSDLDLGRRLLAFGIWRGANAC